MNIEYDLFQTKVTDENQQCGISDCFRIMRVDDHCFVDVKNGVVMCNECGRCEKYSRKKQAEREKSGVVTPPLIKGLDY